MGIVSVILIIAVKIFSVNLYYALLGVHAAWFLPHIDILIYLLMHFIFKLLFIFGFLLWALPIARVF